jgi:hypothetical protein
MLAEAKHEDWSANVFRIVQERSAAEIREDFEDAKNFVVCRKAQASLQAEDGQERPVGRLIKEFA